MRGSGTSTNEPGPVLMGGSVGRIPGRAVGNYRARQHDLLRRWARRVGQPVEPDGRHPPAGAVHHPVAAALDRSSLSLLGALLVGSFIVQTDISTLPVVTAVFAIAATGWLVTRLIDKRRPHPPHAHHRPPWWWAGAGFAVFAAMWTPPVIQQFTTHPGNFTLIYRFFTSGQPGQSFHAALWSVAAVNGILVEGPSEVMSSLLGNPPSHSTVTVVVWIAVVLIGIGVTAIGIRQRLRFASSLGALSLVGCVATVLAVTHVIGFVFGYLVAWDIAVPIAALIGIGMLRWNWPARIPRQRPSLSTVTMRLALGAVAVLVGVVLSVRVGSLPAEHGLRSDGGQARRAR